MRSLDQPQLSGLASAAIERKVGRGTIITLEGDPAEAMYVVTSGRVKVVRYSAEGREQIMHVVEPGDHFNTVPIFDGGPCPATTEALVPTTLLVLPRPAIQDLIRRHPEVAAASRETSLQLIACRPAKTRHTLKRNSTTSPSCMT